MSMTTNADEPDIITIRRSMAQRLNMDDFDYHSHRRDAYRELAEALSRGELPE